MTDIMALIRDKKKQIAAKSNRERPVKPTAGKTRWRILPGWRKDETDKTFFKEFGQHWVKDEEGDIKAVFTCDAVTNSKTCAVCEALQTAKMTADSDSLLNALKEAEARGNFLFNALQLDGEDPTRPVVLTLTPTTADKYFDLMMEYGEEMLDLEAGTDIVITRQGSGFDTKYNILPAAKSKPVDKAVMAQLHDLDAFVVDTDENRIKAISAIGVVSGTSLALPASSAPAGALTGPSEGDGSGLDLDDEIPFDGAAGEAEGASEPEVETTSADKAKDDAAIEDDFAPELAVGEEDIDAMLADL